MKRITLIGVTLASLVLSGCGSPAYNQQMAEAKRKDAEFSNAVKNINLETADVGTSPENYKDIIENAIRGQLKDPDSAKFSAMTTPRKEVMAENRLFVYGYSVCVYVNAKNSYGGYVGDQLYWVFLRDNQVRRIKNTNDQFGNIIFLGRPVNCS